MGLHAKDHLQLAGIARTARSRQPALPGVPLGDRRPSRRMRQAQQTFPGRPTGRSSLSRLQSVQSGGRNAALFNCSWRVQHQRIAEQDPPAPPAGTEQRPGISPVKASSYSWPDQEIGRTYKYYATNFGKQVVATALKLRELVIVPQLAAAAAR